MNSNASPATSIVGRALWHPTITGSTGRLWFAAMSNIGHQPWLVHFIHKLLAGDAAVLQLLARNPFPEGPPRFVRAELYRYEFTELADPHGSWWRRTRVRSYLPPVHKDQREINDYLQRFGWSKEAQAEESGNE